MSIRHLGSFRHSVIGGVGYTRLRARRESIGKSMQGWIVGACENLRNVSQLAHVEALTGRPPPPVVHGSGHFRAAIVQSSFQETTRSGSRWS